MRLHEFQIVAGVPPSTGCVERRADGLEIAENVVVVVERGRSVGRGGRIVEMAGGGAERRGDVVLAVAFVLIKVERVGESLRVELLRGADGECGRGGGH